VEADRVRDVLSVRRDAVLSQTRLRASALKMLHVGRTLRWVARDIEHLLIHVERSIPGSDRTGREVLNLSAVLSTNGLLDCRPRLRDRYPKLVAWHC